MFKLPVKLFLTLLFAGSIPPGLGNLAALETLNLFINQLEGTLVYVVRCTCFSWFPPDQMEHQSRASVGRTVLEAAGFGYETKIHRISPVSRLLDNSRCLSFVRALECALQYTSETKNI